MDTEAAYHQSDQIARILGAVRAAVGQPVEGRALPLHEPEFAGNEWTYVKECIDTGWVSSVGKFVDRFEEDLASYTGVKHAVAVVNGTAALHVGLLLAGVKPGDEVLLPTLTFIATANAVSYTGATPHFVDSDEATLGVDPEQLEKHLAEIAELRDGTCYNRVTGARLAALVVMHAFGHPAHIAQLAELADRWRLALVEDAAESLGSFVGGRHTGGFGCVAALSFNGNKVLTTGGGGAILTDDTALARRAKHLTTTARVPHRWNFIHDEVGFNYRLPNINAALGCAQLERLDDMLGRKRALAKRYAEAFAGIEGVQFFAEAQGTRSNFWLCTVLLDQADPEVHEAVLTELNDAGLMARPLWTLMHRLPMFAKAPRADLTRAENLASRVINLPSSPSLVDHLGGS
jgi:perosamine synthetase